MKFIDFSDIRITEGFWKQKQDMNKQITVKAVCDRFSDTHRFDALKCDWKEKGAYAAHLFWDSDIAKWIEGVAYLLEHERNAQLEKLVDDAVEDIVKNADENGYFNSYYLVEHQEERFAHRDCHELYCLGHLIEAAVAYDKATGKNALLKAVCKYTDYVEMVFEKEGSAAFVTPGHPEIELALVKLYEHTQEKRYLELARFFVDKHGNNAVEKDVPVYDWAELKYNMDEMPLRDRETVEGHAVRAMYLLAGMADIAEIYGDNDLKNACKRCYDNTANKKMYITGGLGSTHIGEAFTVDYHLPNRTAYAETCAAIALVLFARRMQKLEINSNFADTVERAMYNGVLSGISMDGKSFFYENPLAVDPEFNSVNTSTKAKERYPITERLEVFNCSCCPPNMVRFLASIAGLMYSYTEDTLYVDQYINSTAENKNFYIQQTTDYPASGNIKIKYQCNKKYIALRVPDWCTAFTLNKAYKLKNGYAIIENTGDDIDLCLDMPIVCIAANPRIHENAGKVAVMRGPIVYCAEGVDNGRDVCSVVIPRNAEFSVAKKDFILPSVEVGVYKPKEKKALYYIADDDLEEMKLKLIPYYAFANRGTSEMVVWFNRGF